MPAIGAKECIFNLNLAFLDPGRRGAGRGSRLSGVHVRPADRRSRGRADCRWCPSGASSPISTRSTPRRRRRAKLLYLNYPNNPTGAVVPEGFFERVVAFAEQHRPARGPRQRLQRDRYDGYRAPSFLATPGAKDVGVEVFSLSKGYNMTGWRCAAIVGNAEAINTYWRLKSNVDSGNFEAVQLAGVAALSPDADAEVASMNELYRRRRDLVVDALAQDRRRRRGRRRATIYIWAPVPEGFRVLGRLLRARPGGGRRRGLARGRLRPQRRGLLPHLADHPGRSACSRRWSGSGGWPRSGGTSRAWRSACDLRAAAGPPTIALSEPQSQRTQQAVARRERRAPRAREAAGLLHRGGARGRRPLRAA